jgi:hypothetical protein
MLIVSPPRDVEPDRVVGGACREPVRAQRRVFHRSSPDAVGDERRHPRRKYVGADGNLPGDAGLGFFE